MDNPAKYSPQLTAPLRFSASQIVLQEIPGEISLSYLITGCPIGCKGCHSADSWDPRLGELLSPQRLAADIAHSQNLVSCVLLMGGEWHGEVLLALLQQCRRAGLKTALFTGLEYCPADLLPWLDYVKTGPWRAELGGLDHPASNQRLYDLQRGLCLNPLFWPTACPAIPALLPQLQGKHHASA